jgi:hypothetical protein
LSEKEILQSVRKILDTIQVHEKEWTGGRTKKYATLKKRIFAGRLPVDLINEIHLFKGSNTYHLERALRLYVKVLGSGDRTPVVASREDSEVRSRKGENTFHKE